MAIGLVVNEASDEFLTIYIVLDPETVSNAVVFGLSLVDMPISRFNLREVRVVERTVDGLGYFIFHPAHHYLFSWLVAAAGRVLMSPDGAFPRLL